MGKAVTESFGLELAHKGPQELNTMCQCQTAVYVRFNIDPSSHAAMCKSVPLVLRWRFGPFSICHVTACHVMASFPCIACIADLQKLMACIVRTKPLSWAWEGALESQQSTSSSWAASKYNALNWRGFVLTLVRANTRCDNCCAGNSFCGAGQMERQVGRWTGVWGRSADEEVHGPTR